MTKRNIISLVILLFSLQYLCFAETLNQDQIIELKRGNYSIDQIIKNLEKDPNLNLSYNSNDVPLNMIIYNDIVNPTISQLIKAIQEQSPIEIIQNENYLVIRQKKLEKTYTISGKLKDGEINEAMVGVNVYIKESKKGAITGPDGNYSLTAAPGTYTLVISFIGYSTKEIEIRLYDDIKLDMILFPERTQLDEVKIIGERQFFGDLKQGRTIETIETKELELIKTNNVADVLQARIPGVWVTKVSGAPGDHNQIRIRGINSLFGGVDPLYVIDGVPVPIVNLHSLGISDLNIHDVENITVLKDASSNAIYGFQGGNGVIIIDTKRGGDKEISFSVTKGIQENPVKYDLFNSIDFKNSLDSAAKKGISGINLHYPDITDTLCNDDWQNNLFQVGIINEYQLSANGQLKKTNYHFSGNYYNHEGIIKNTEYSKYSLSGSLGRNFFNRLTVEGVYKTTLQKNNNNLDSYWGNRVIVEEINKSPSYNCTPDEYYEDSLDNVYVRTYITYPDLNTRENPDSLIKLTNKSLGVTTHNFSGFSSLRILDNLLLNYSVAYVKRNHDYETEISSYKYSPEYNNYLLSNESYALLNNQFNLTYNIILNKHTINFVASSKFYRDMVEWHLDSLDLDFDTKSKLENLYTRGNLSIQGETGKAIRHINSIIEHINYNYAEKYFISLAANYENLREGNTRIISKIFPSVALKWNIAKENHINRITWLNNFNLLYNYGISGNYPLNSLSRDLFTTEHYYVSPNQKLTGYSLDNLTNHKLNPEIIKGYNVGIECSLFKDKIAFQSNYFSKKNEDLIIQRDIPLYYGGGRTFVNIAEMKIDGYEFKLELYPIVNSNWQWYNRFNFTTFKQIVKKLDGNNKYFFNREILIPDFVIKENEEIGNIYGYKYLGKEITRSSEDDFENTIFINGGMYANLDSNYKTLDTSDMVVIGNIIPDFTFNFFSSIQYKNFTLDMLWYAVVGVDKFNSTRTSTYITGLNPEINQFINDTNEVIASEEFYQSSYFIEDASFIRLKNLSISYSPNKLISNKIKLKFTLGIDNLITFTNYKGFDPETTIYTDNTFSDNAVDFGAYPNPRSYYLSIKMKL
ncbi:SusC/RagA family TonB-linked outer membrane protein [Bacteroidota bacterium]